MAQVQYIEIEYKNDNNDNILKFSCSPDMKLPPASGMFMAKIHKTFPMSL